MRILQQIDPDPSMVYIDNIIKKSKKFSDDYQPVSDDSYMIRRAKQNQTPVY